MSSLRVLWPFFKAQSSRFTLGIILSALTFISTVSLLSVSGWLIARAAQMPAIMELNIAVVAVRTFSLLRSTSRYTERLLSHDATFRSLTAMRLKLYEKLEELAPHGLSEFRRGDLISRVVTDVDEIQNLPLRVVIPVISSILASVFTVALVMWILPLAGIALFVALLLASTLVPWLVTKNTLQQESEVAGIRGQLSGQIIEHFAGLTDIMMLGAADSSLKAIEETNNSLLRTERNNASRIGLANALLILLQGLALVASVTAATKSVQDGSLSPVTMVVVSLLPLAAFESVMNLPAAVLAYSRVSGSTKRLTEILSLPTVSNTKEILEIASTDIQLEDVELRWPGTDESVVSNLSMQVVDSSRVGIVGPSGSGKSTIVQLLVKFLSPINGRYLLGGKDVRDVNGVQLRQKIVATGHDAHLFNTSIRENLVLASPVAVTEEEIWKVLEDVSLAAWARSLPNSIDTVVGENGSSVSGGQRQRLLMARMLLSNPKVWVLDEPTEHLDTQLASSLMDAIHAKSKDSTLIIVSHRQADVQGSDKIVDLEQ
jgi:thiol reductant ABC exporter CydC subunit